ncbi:MAG: lamin tail domain-containing protein [Deltaproteobacteria bacterium]|nr:lamin tail domain-containing protein [Deltaproteobacteria bacterium]
MMHPSRSILSLCLATALTFLGGCPEKQSTEEEAVVVLPGKTDNYLAPTAREYRVEGTTTVTLEASYAGLPEDQRLERARELVSLKQVVIAWFLNAYLIDKSSHDDNKDYGGFRGMTKNGSWEDLNLTLVSGETYTFQFMQEVGGANDLIDRLDTRVDAEGVHHFDLIVGKISNTDMAKLETNAEWYRSSPWSDFNPATVDPARVETLDLKITPQPRSIDAWIDYGRLFNDGKLTVSAHFGWDYHKEYHLVHSEAVYDWLIARGFESPVGSYDEYLRDSGPLKRTIQANGKAVEVEVSLFWGKPGTDTDPDTAAGGIQLEDDLRAALATNDVIIYSGHSGAFYGFAMANWRMTDEGDLDDSEVPGLTLPSKYQVVLAEGCDTYGMGQAFMMNPAKTARDNIDVITTTSFSNAGTASTVTDFLRAVLGTDAEGNQVAKKYGELLSDLDSNSSWFHTMYGVHGIDDNPHAHPYGNPAGLCGECKEDADCGGAGNLCAKLNDQERVCSFECTADDGCPAGYKCYDIARGSWLTTKACVPDGLSCEAPEPEPSSGGTVILNEIGADPPADLSGDWNGDGTRSASEDEFVELVNTTAEPLRIGGWTFSDGYGARFTFPSDAVIPARGAVLIFGGGTPGNFRGVQAFTSERGLGLNNTGDTLTLADERGSEVDRITYGAEGGQDASLVRGTDGDRSAGLVVHGGGGASPGTRQDGSDF